jgi:hypothetical protein
MRTTIRARPHGWPGLAVALAVSAVALAAVLGVAPRSAHAAAGCSFVPDSPLEAGGMGDYQDGDVRVGPADRTNPRAVRYALWRCAGATWVYQGSWCIGEECPDADERRKVADRHQSSSDAESWDGRAGLPRADPVP